VIVAREYCVGGPVRDRGRRRRDRDSSIAVFVESCRERDRNFTSEFAAVTVICFLKTETNGKAFG
jgi:hypothetical protein